MCMICSLVALFNLNTELYKINPNEYWNLYRSLHVFWVVLQTVYKLADWHLSFTYLVDGCKHGKPAKNEKMNYPFTLMAASIDLARCSRIGMVHLFFCAEQSLYNTPHYNTYLNIIKWSCCGTQIDQGLYCFPLHHSLLKTLLNGLPQIWT